MGYFGILSDTLGRATLSRQVGTQLRFLRLNQKEKMVEAVGIEPTTCTFPLTGFAFIGVHYECIEVHISMLFN